MVEKHMAAVLLKGHGGFEQLEFRTDTAVPVPDEGEVLIKVGAAGVNNTDINTRIGWYSKSVANGTPSEGDSSGLTAANSGDASWAGSALVFPRIQGADVCG